MNKANYFRTIFILLILISATSLSGCAIKLTDKGQRLLDEVLGKFETFYDDQVWEEDDDEVSKAPTVDEMLESGEMVSDTDSPVGEIGSEITDEEAKFATEGMIRYSYAMLNDEEKIAYKEIYMILINQAEEVKLTTKDADVVDKVFRLVMNDHPEIFYVTGYKMNTYTINDEIDSLDFTGTYEKNNDVVEIVTYDIDRYSAKCLTRMPEYDTDYEKVKYIYEYIIDNTEYDLEAEDNQNILSVFKDGKSVCQGYAKATQYLLNKSGIPCLLVTGTAKNEAHAWNIAYVDGKWTSIDTTWGDASYRNVSTGETWNEITYDYLCVGDEDIFDTHRYESLIDLPPTYRLQD